LDDSDYSSNRPPLLESFSLQLLDCLGFKIPQDLDPAAMQRMNPAEVEETHRQINQFIEYIIERNIRSEPFLISI
jgi:hypothetical protein